MSKSIEVSRQDLYDLVWSEPILKLANRFGLSDRGLAKKCASHKIPTPPRGYWAKQQSGHSVEQAPLPENEEQYLEIVTIWPTPETSEEGKSPINHQLTDEQLAIALSFKIPERVNRYHKSISACRADHKSKKNPWGTDQYGRINFSRNIANPGFKVTPKSFDRASLFLQGFIKLFSSFGWEYVEIKSRYGDNDTWGWKLGGETLKIELKEPAKKVKREESSNKTQKSGSLYLGEYTRQEYRATGILEFSIETYSPSFQIHWKDKGTDRIENHIADIAISFSKTFEHERLRTIEREIKHRKREEEERKRAEQRSLRKIEEKRREQLIALASRHDTVTRVRKLLDEIHSRCEINEELSNWLNWAESVVEEMDALRNTGRIVEEYTEIAEKYYY